ncbi:hypothetical protein [Kitasatospora sp. NPDC001175]
MTTPPIPLPGPDKPPGPMVPASGTRTGPARRCARPKKRTN